MISNIHTNNYRYDPIANILQGDLVRLNLRYATLGYFINMLNLKYPWKFCKYKRVNKTIQSQWCRSYINNFWGVKTQNFLFQVEMCNDTIYCYNYEYIKVNIYCIIGSFLKLGNLSGEYNWVEYIFKILNISKILNVSKILSRSNNAIS